MTSDQNPDPAHVNFLDHPTLRMTNHNQTAYVARVTRVGAAREAGGRVVFYAVLADNRQAALAAIEAAVQPSDYVEITDGKLSPETVRALDLQPDQAKAM